MPVLLNLIQSPSLSLGHEELDVTVKFRVSLRPNLGFISYRGIFMDTPLNVLMSLHLSAVTLIASVEIMMSSMGILLCTQLY